MSFSWWFVRRSGFATKRGQDLREKLISFSLLLLGAIVLLIPIAYMVGGALGSKLTTRVSPPSVIPLEARQITVDGEKAFIYRVKIDGIERELADIGHQGSTWTYADPQDLSKTWKLPALGSESRVLEPAIHLENFGLAFEKIPFFRYIINTIVLMALITIGALVSNVIVSYGFARFRMRGSNQLFIILLATIMLPSQVVLIPSFVLFYSIGWYNTWLPLIVPAFFANAWNVFLIRQFMVGLPRELDESARIDGCGPIKILWYILLPQLKPILITVMLFTLIYVWNDFFTPLIYLQDDQLFPVSLGIQTFNALHTADIFLGNALSLMLALPPVLVFFFAQRFFIQGTVISGIKG